jgi:hypothetical protein
LGELCDDRFPYPKKSLPCYSQRASGEAVLPGFYNYNMSEFSAIAKLGSGGFVKTVILPICYIIYIYLLSRDFFDTRKSN